MFSPEIALITGVHPASVRPSPSPPSQPGTGSLAPFAAAPARAKKSQQCLEQNVTDADACWEVFYQAEKVHGKIDVLINNAGMSWLGAVEDFT